MFVLMIWFCVCGYFVVFVVGFGCVCMDLFLYVG